MKMMAFYKLIITITIITIAKSEADHLEVLGFQSWQQPSAQQIKAQFEKLTKSFKEKNSPSASQKQKYQKIEQSYKYLKSRNFANSQSSNEERANSRRRRERPRSRGYYRTDQYYENDGFFSQSSTYHPNSEEKEDFQDFMKGIFDDINLGFVHLQAQRDSKSKSFGTFRIKTDQFFSWLCENPPILISAFLISIGIIQLCRWCYQCCCCCCCCNCAKRHQQKDQLQNLENKYMMKSNKQSDDDRNRNGINRDKSS